MSFDTIDDLFDLAHVEPFDTCANCLAAINDTANPDAVRQFAHRRHDESIRHEALVAAILRPRATDGQTVTYEISNRLDRR